MNIIPFDSFDPGPAVDGVILDSHRAIIHVIDAVGIAGMMNLNDKAKNQSSPETPVTRTPEPDPAASA